MDARRRLSDLQRERLLVLDEMLRSDVLPYLESKREAHPEAVEMLTGLARRLTPLREGLAAQASVAQASCSE